MTDDADRYTQEALDEDDAVEPLPEPVCLTHLTPEALAEYWPDFTEWVLWLRTRYSLANRQLPTCWHAHGALVEELSALHTAWLLAYHPAAPANAPLDWHSSFHYARLRMKDWAADMGACTDHDKDHDDDRHVTNPFATEIASAAPGGREYQQPGLPD